MELDRCVDILVLVIAPGAGDSLQAVKKGIMEAADLVIVNKADGDLLASANITAANYMGAMQFIRQKHVDWKPQVVMMSSHNKTDAHLDKIEQTIQSFYDVMAGNGYIQRKRAVQAKYWTLQHFKKVFFEEMEEREDFKRLLLSQLSSFDQLDRDREPIARLEARKLLNRVHTVIDE